MRALAAVLCADASARVAEARAELGRLGSGKRCFGRFLGSPNGDFSREFAASRHGRNLLRSAPILQCPCGSEWLDVLGS